MRKIELTQDKVALVDDLNFEYLNQFNWSYKDGYAAGKVTMPDGRQKTVYMHHCVVGRPLNGQEVDHISGDRLDNQQINLRIVTRRQNAQNYPIHRSGRLPGATLKKGNLSKPWQAQITIDDKKKHLGYFKTELEAHQAYLVAQK
jgi:hypothetical protein